MWVNKREVEQLSDYVKGFSSEDETDIRDNKEGAFSILKNDIYSLVSMKNEQLKNAKKQRDVLAEYMADISHQLKTPITSMMIMADLLEEASDDKREEFVHNIKLSLSKMEWLVETLLKMAKIDAKAVAFSKESMKVSELLAGVRPGIDILLDINNQTIEMVNDSTISCDRRWTMEAFSNIVKNALEHSPNGGVIRIDSGSNPMYEWIAIKDSGAGMNRRDLGVLFHRFEYSTNENGYGIGMPLALSIMKGQNGDIDIDYGGNGQGATFIMKFFK